MRYYSIGTLKALLELVEVKPEVCGGEPVFKGTQINIDHIAGMIQKARNEKEVLAEIKEDYPMLTDSMLELAQHVILEKK